jgi:hypothetical protein
MSASYRKARFNLISREVTRPVNLLHAQKKSRRHERGKSKGVGTYVSTVTSLDSTWPMMFTSQVVGMELLFSDESSYFALNDCGVCVTLGKLINYIQQLVNSFPFLNNFWPVHTVSQTVPLSEHTRRGHVPPGSLTARGL